MYNLHPEIGELNELRADLPMAEVPPNLEFFVPALQVKMGRGQFEPRPEVKGDVARTYLYMDAAYPGLGIIPDSATRAMFNAWSREDPADAWECERARRISVLQGNVNDVVATACELDRVAQR